MFFFKNKKIPLTELFDNTFVDIHSHLLPGIDDGAKNLDNSIALITKMASYGIKNFITTPHVLGDVYPNSSSVILEKLELVKNELSVRGLKDINIKAAAEYMLDEQFSERLAKDDILAVKDNLVLVEMSYYNAPYNLYEIIFDIQNKGYKPILAHPERYNFYHQDFQSYYKLKKAGCLFQLNLLSLTQQYGKGVKNTAEKLLKENLYDYVGTDTHHENHLRLLGTLGNKKTSEKIKTLVEKNSFFFQEFKPAASL